MATKFEVGKKYGHYLNDEWMLVEILSRTAKTAVIRKGCADEAGEVKYADETEKKVIRTDKDGNEFLGSDFGTYLSREFECANDRRARIQKEIAEKKEEERQARLAVSIPKTSEHEVEPIVRDVILAWALNNDLENLVRYAKSIDTGFVSICANPEDNCALKKLFFPCGAQVWIHDGHRDKFVTDVFSGEIHASRSRITDNFTVEATHSYAYGMRLTPEGVWLDRDGKKWEPNWEAMNN